MPNPTLYDPKYCDEVIEFMAKGYSFGAFAGSIRVARTSLNRWRKSHPDFEEACQIGLAARTYSLEKDMMTTESLAIARARFYALKNADPIEWRDKREVEHSGKVQSEVVDAAALAKMTDEELEQLERAREIIDRATAGIGDPEPDGDQG